MLPARIPKKPKRSTRWRSQAHCNFVRSHVGERTFWSDVPVETIIAEFIKASPKRRDGDRR
jgi:hypothetical protein